ncbi:MAG: FeoB small GTPase domain-containing protein [Ignavibacteriaceae bacterium]
MSEIEKVKASAGCETCAVHNKGNLVRLGINLNNIDYVVALAGNPNTGKSTVFNALTGLRQHTGNWPGKTVTRAEGGFLYNEQKYKIVDLPGTYSLLSTSTDEEVARDFILFGQPDVTVIVADATRLERNLNLILQVLEITDRAVVCLNLIDEAKRHNITIDDRKLSKELGVPVIPTAARQSVGIKDLLKNIYEVANGTYVCKPHRITTGSREVKRAVETLTKQILDEFPGLPNARWVALRLLEGDQRIIDAVKSGELGNLSRKNEMQEAFVTK